MSFESTKQSRNVDSVFVYGLLDTKEYEHTVKTELL